jgi:hypothetical protein
MQCEMKKLGWSSFLLHGTKMSARRRFIRSFLCVRVGAKFHCKITFYLIIIINCLPFKCTCCPSATAEKEEDLAKSLRNESAFL